MSEIENLRSKIDGAWKELDGLVDAMEPAVLDTTGLDDWALKDHLTHVAAWELSLIGLIEGKNRLEAMGLTSDVDRSTDAINAALFEMHRGKTVDEALDYFRETHAELMGLLGTMSDSDLERPYSHFQSSAAQDEGSDLPVIGWVAGNTYDHYHEHVGWIRASVAKGS